MSDLPGLLTLAADNTASEVHLEPETLAVLLYALAKIRNPDTWRDYYGEYISDSDRELIHELVDLALDDIMRPLVIPEPIYPKQFFCFGQTGKMAGSGSLQTIQLNATQFSQYTRVQTPYINNEYEFEVLMAAGNWHINYMGFSNNSSGQVRLRLDRTDTIFLNDYYTATQVLNVNSANNIDIEVLTAGIHTVGFKMASKHASSSNYNFFLQAVWGTWESEL